MSRIEKKRLYAARVRLLPVSRGGRAVIPFPHYAPMVQFPEGNYWSVAIEWIDPPQYADIWFRCAASLPVMAPPLSGYLELYEGSHLVGEIEFSPPNKSSDP